MMVMSTEGKGNSPIGDILGYLEALDPKKYYWVRDDLLPIHELLQECAGVPEMETPHNYRFYGKSVYVQRAKMPHLPPGKWQMIAHDSDVSLLVK